MDPGPGRPCCQNAEEHLLQSLARGEKESVRGDWLPLLDFLERTQYPPFEYKGPHAVPRIIRIIMMVGLHIRESKWRNNGCPL